MKFVRADSCRYSKLGKKRKKLQKWRKPKGRDNKAREKRKGYQRSPTVGYKKPHSESGKIGNKIPLNVSNLKDLKDVSKENIIIINKIGAKKKMEIIKMAEESKIKILNLGKKNETR